MGLQDETLNFYEENAESFTSGTISADMKDARSRFLERLPFPARILDFGCGSGRDTKAFLDAGYTVDAVDGSPKLCRAASEYTGICVKQMLFQELEEENAYDGIWACASLLHVPKVQIRDVMEKVSRALKEQGVLYASFKYGDDEKTVDGRLFSLYNETDLEWISDLGLIEYWITDDVRTEHVGAKWLNTLWRKV